MRGSLPDMSASSGGWPPLPAPPARHCAARDSRVQRLIHVQPTGRAAEPPRRASIQQHGRRASPSAPLLNPAPCPRRRGALLSRRAALSAVCRCSAHPSRCCIRRPRRIETPRAPSISPQQTTSSGCTNTPRAVGCAHPDRSAPPAARRTMPAQSSPKTGAWRTSIVRTASPISPRAAPSSAVCRMLASIPSRVRPPISPASFIRPALPR